MRYAITAAVLTGLLASAPSVAQESGALWSTAPRPMSDYITEGWSIVSHTYEQYDNGNDYSFVLQKGNQAVICFVWRPTKGNMSSSCRRLN